MVYLTDTNVLLGFSFPADPRHPIVRAAVRKLMADGHQLQTTSQNFAEFWNVSTRPIDRNGFGRTPSEANVLLRNLEMLFPLMSDLPDTYPVWRRLVVDYRVSGVQVHDARLVASMIVHGVTHILTFDTKDFTRYESEGIIPIDPVTV